jgi:hypothetical protein
MNSESHRHYSGVTQLRERYYEFRRYSLGLCPEPGTQYAYLITTHDTIALPCITTIFSHLIIRYAILSMLVEYSLATSSTNPTRTLPLRHIIPSISNRAMLPTTQRTVATGVPSAMPEADFLGSLSDSKEGLRCLFDKAEACANTSSYHSHTLHIDAPVRWAYLRTSRRK